MRFLAELFPGEKDDGNTYSFGPIHGPYPNDKAMEVAIARLSPKDRVTLFLVLEGQMIKVGPERKTRAVGNLISQNVLPIFEDGIRWRLSEGSWWDMFPWRRSRP